MLTRAYDTIMASLQVPMIIDQNVDFNNSAIDDSILNCKDYAGNIRCVVAELVESNGFYSARVDAYYIPFCGWNVNHTNWNTLLPDEDELEPNYEDYAVIDGTPSGWTASSSTPSFTKEYDPDTKEIVCSVTILWQNTSGAAKTVYGVKVRCRYNYRPSYSSTSYGSSYFLICREHFAAPVVVEDQCIISLTFTWRVGRAGLVGATAAAAE